MENITAEKPIAADAADEHYRLIAQAIDEVRPYLKADGGDCELIAVDGNLVTVRLAGACVGCQLSGATLNGVQQKVIEKLGFPIRIVQAPSKPGPSRPFILPHH